jgi:hypothetical protein
MAEAAPVLDEKPSCQWAHLLLAETLVQIASIISALCHKESNTTRNIDRYGYVAARQVALKNRKHGK